MTFSHTRAASGEDPLALPRSRAVARDDDRKIRPHGGQHVCVMQNAGRVSAVCPADEQKDIRLSRRIWSISSSVSSNENCPIGFAPAPRLAMRAASSVSSGTRPDTIVHDHTRGSEQA